MRHYILANPEGAILQTRTQPDHRPAPDGDWVEVAELPVMSGQDRLWWDGSALQPRLPLPEPASAEVGAELHLTWSGLPAGTSAEVHDIEAGVSLGEDVEDGGTLVIELAEPGAYLITLTPPATHLPAELRVEVP